MLFDYRDNFNQILFAHDGSRGIIRIKHNDQLCFRRNRCFYFIGSQFKIILGFGVNGDNIASADLYDRAIANKARLNKQNIITG